MKRPYSLFAAMTAAGVVLVFGFALVRLGAKKRETERRARATQAAATAASLMERQLDSLAVAVLSAAMEISRHGAAAGSPAASAGGFATKGANLFFVSSGAEPQTVPLEGRPLRFEDLPGDGWTALASSASRPPAIARRPDLLGPFETATGEWLVLARVFVPPPSESNPQPLSGWLVGTLPVERLVTSSGLQELGSEGYDYQLAGKDPVRGALRVFWTSTESGLNDPVRQEVLGSGGGWSLLVAPKDAWSPRLPLLGQGVLVMIIALVAGLYTRDRADKQERLQREIEKGRDRLKKAGHRLSEEIEQRQALERQFSHASFHDALTGLPNRRYFLDHLERALQRARRVPDFIVGVLVLNLDRFKIVNESLGHQAGEKLLVAASERLQGCLRSSDMATARLGEGEFAVLLFDVSGPSYALDVARRVQEAMTQPFDLSGQTVFTTASLGIALSSSGIYHADELVRGANIALSRSRIEERGRCVIFDPSAGDQIVARQLLETDLYQAIERGQLRLSFQPIIDLEAGHISGMETLIRWHHPLEGLVPPHRFIPMAEETGLIVPITRWVMREACAQARAWRERFPSDLSFYLSVNLSAEDLREADLCEFVGGVIRESSLPPSVLRLEVTEGMMIGNVQAASDLVSRLRGMGVPILLDDFGTGYSSLSYLQLFKFDYLKIDQAFVRRITGVGENIAFVCAIVDLASALDLRTIAEGVETGDILKHLRALGCNYGQGYLFSRPIDPASAERLLLSRPKW